MTFSCFCLLVQEKKIFQVFDYKKTLGFKFEFTERFGIKGSRVNPENCHSQLDANNLVSRALLAIDASAQHLDKYPVQTMP